MVLLEPLLELVSGQKLSEGSYFFILDRVKDLPGLFDADRIDPNNNVILNLWQLF